MMGKYAAWNNYMNKLAKDTNSWLYPQISSRVVSKNPFKTSKKHTDSDEEELDDFLKSNPVTLTHKRKHKTISQIADKSLKEFMDKEKIIKRKRFLKRMRKEDIKSMLNFMKKNDDNYTLRKYFNNSEIFD